MKKIFINLTALVFAFATIAPSISAASTEEEPTQEIIILENEDDFLYDIGTEDPELNEFMYDNMKDYLDSSNDQVIQPYFAQFLPIIVTVVVNGLKVSKHVYKAIKYAPKYPKGFKAVQNGTKNVTVNNKSLLAELRQIESGTWKKVYKDGYDANGKKISIHYFQSKSGLVYDVKVKSGWSNS